jgi:hypothetical protein
MLQKQITKDIKSVFTITNVIKFKCVNIFYFDIIILCQSEK